MAADMEVDTMSIPLSVLNDDREHTMYYSQSLPYADRLEAEPENWLAQVCENIAIHVKAGDLAPGTFAWVKRLESYREMKHAIPRETRAKLAKLLYELTVTPGMDTSLVEYWATVCVRLIRKPERIGPEDLTLDWRPLYQLIKKHISPKTRQVTLIAETKHITAVIRLAEYAQRFYPPTATEEILQELLPSFTTHHAEDALTVQGFLSLFVPVSQPKHSITKAKLYDNGIHPKEYLPTIFSMWSMVTSSFLFDAQCIELLSRIAEANVSEPFPVFSNDQIKTVFTACLRIMNLPVGSRVDGNSSSGNRTGGSSGHNQYAGRVDLKAGSALILRRKPEKYKALSRFMVYTMFPAGEGGQSDVLDLLSNLVQAIELYYHPSNHGTWSYSLAAFTQCLSGDFLQRWREEQKDDCDTPVERRLTPEMKQKFVLILRPLAYLTMFGKDNYIVSFAQTTLRRLAWLEPSLIFPGLLERIYSSLETLTETHRTSSAIQVLAEMAHPLLYRDHYPAGGKHLLPLLHLVTPGIDLVDPPKSISIIQFIANAVMLVPVMDLTKGSGYDPVENEVRYEGMEIDTSGHEKELSPEEEDKLCKASTEGFEDWLAKFLRQSFMVFENLPTSYKSSSPAAENSVVHVLLVTCDTLFQQLSDDLYDMALRMVVDFLTSQVLPNAFHPIGILCRGLAKANPSKAAKKLIPLCISNIQTELEHGASSHIVNSSAATPIQSDSTLHWYQSILFEVCSVLGAELLNYKQELTSIIREMLDKCKTRTGFMWASKALRHILRSLLSIYPNEMRSFSPEEWNDKDFMKSSHRLWGKPGNPQNLRIDWHVPSEKEIDLAMELLETFLVPSIDHVEKLFNDQGQKSAAELTNEFCKHLAIIRNCLLGSTCLIGEDGIDPDKNIDETKSSSGDEEPAASYTFAKLEAGYALTDTSDPRYIRTKELRKNVAELIHKALTYFYEKSEDDVERMKLILKLARSFLDDMGVEKSVLDLLKTRYSYAKPMFQTPVARKEYPRRLLVLRAYLHHLQRLRHNAHGRIPEELHMSIFNDLVKLSMSSYAVVRKTSQNALAATAKNFTGAKGSLMTSILEGLQRDENLDPEAQADRLKGALYLLRHKSILSSCLRDWRFIPKFVTSLCQAQHEDKVSVQTLIRKVFLDYVTHFTFRNYQIIDTSHVDENIQQLCDLAAVSSRIDTTTSKVLERHQRQSKAYQELMEFLIVFMQDSKVHWRFATMAASLLDLFVRPQYAPTADLAKIACDCTLSDLPGLRHVGSELTTQLLDFIKRRTYANGDETALLRGNIENPLKKEVSLNLEDENFTNDFIKKLYDPVTESNYRDCLFADGHAKGWLVWPNSYTFYVASTGDSFLSNVDDKCREAYDEFRKVFTTESYWKKLGDFMSQEISNPQEDVFHTSNALLCKSIFKIYWNEPLHEAKQIITQFCDASDQKNQQRAGAELVAGLVRGMKHWPIAKSAKVWEWLSPLLQKTFANITPDSLTYWESCVRYCAQRRDPRRILPLIEIIFGAGFDANSDAAFVEASKLILKKAILNTLTWWATPLADRLLPTLFDNIQHPYKQVREAIASDINAAVQLHWTPGFHSIDDLLQRARQGPLMPLATCGQDTVYLETLLGNLDRWQSELQPAHIAGSQDYINGSKTVLCWLTEGLTRWRVAGTIPFTRSLWPKIFIMQEVHDDQDLQQMSGKVLQFFAQYYYPPSIIASILEQFIQVLTGSESWRIRIRALPILQIFYFKNYFFMEADQRARIMDVVSDMLLDTQLEVRQMAAVTLGGLVRCSQRDTIDIVRERFTKLLQTNIPRRKRSRETGKIIETPEFRVALLKKHAGVLGLSCLVNAFPYDVPKWMPEVVCQLAECMSDPAEIQATIRKTFSDFKRTHCDTWHEDMTKFTEEQLSTLNDVLISPSYYA